MKHTTLFLILFLSFAKLALGQSFTLTGKVTDAKTNSPLQGAVVFISYNYMAYTNGDGEYSINQLSEGAYDIKISSLGYKPISLKIKIDSAITFTKTS